MIFKSYDKFLAVSEADDPDNFKLPGGKFEGREKPEEALNRELREELNLSSTDYSCELVATLKTNEEGDNRYIFRIKLKDGSRVKPVKNEIAKFKLVNDRSIPEGKNKNHILSAVEACGT